MFMRRLAILSVLTLTLPAVADQATTVRNFSVSADRFRFSGAENDFKAIPTAVWNPHRPFAALPQFSKANVSVFFHGNNASAQCGGGVVANSTSFKANTDAAAVLAETGLKDAQAWWPQCPDGGSYGASYYAASHADEPGHTGIGLYTYSGPAQGKPESPAFFQSAYSAKRIPYIQALYVNFPVQEQGTMRPFGASCSGDGCGDRVRMRVSAEQGVPAVSNVIGITQSQQKLTVVLANTRSDRRPARQKIIKFIPHTFCQGSGCGRSDKASMGYDFAYWVGGPIGKRGKATVLRGTDQPVWRSDGEASQSEAFKTGTFAYEMSWNDFTATLRYVAATHHKSVEAMFGEGWDTPSNWVLAQAKFGQEVRNANWNPAGPTPSVSYIGGHLGWMEVDAVVR